MTRRNFMLSSGAAALSAAAQRKLNFVFFLIDDLGWADVSCYGNRYHETPNIDRLATQGMRFTDAYAACPVCSPTRASIMTGKYPARLGLTYVLHHPRFPKRKYLDPVLPTELALSEVTIPEALKPAGYVSASIGKWHLGGEGFYPENQGFDVNVGGSGIGMLNSHFYPGWSRGPGRVDDVKAPLAMDAPNGAYMADYLTGKANEFLESNRNKPFFLYLSHYAVHTPIEGKEELVAKYRKKECPPQQNPVYAAMMESMDQSIGSVLRKLDDLKLADDTVVIFTSDNGGLTSQEGRNNNTPPTTNAPLRDGKKYLWEGGIRVPLIVRWPGVVKPGTTTDVLAISNDFLPTMAEIAGVKPPANDGVSLVPVLKGRGRLRRDALYWHVPHYNRPGAAIRKGDYKLIEFWDPQGRELYNLKEDIGESRNLYKTMPDKARELEKALHEWQKAVGAKMMTPSPEYKP